MDGKLQNMQNKRTFLVAIVIFLIPVTLMLLACRNPTGGFTDDGNGSGNTPPGQPPPDSGGSEVIVTPWTPPIAPTTFTVSFETNGGSSVANITGNPTILSAPEVPTWAGFVFTGWFTNPGLTGDRVTFPLILTSNITLYARWSSSIPVATAGDLDAIRNNLSGHFVQIADIDLGAAPWNP